MAEIGTPVWWEERYRSGDTPWDTGMVPPEVVELVRSGRARGEWALDLGCGPGVTACYLAAAGFKVAGVDLATGALRRARAAAATGVLPAIFCRGDAADLSFLRVSASVAVDVGCHHALAPERRRRYIASLSARLLPGAWYLLYAFTRPMSDAGVAVDEIGPGLTPVDIASFAPWFSVREVQHGRDGERFSVWCLFQRTACAAP